MIERKVLRGFAIALSLGVALPAMAADLDAEDTLVVEEESIFTFTGGIGIVSLEANEFVYAAPGSDTRLSQLIWQSTAPMLTAGLDVNLPEGWTLAAKAQVALGGDSYMEDYDWIAPWATGTGDDDWSHRSQHEDTDLDWYFNGSILLGHDFAVSDNVTVNLNGGFKYTDVQWAAYGGSYVYSSGGYRNDVGDFPDGEAGITYRQSFPALVAGIDAEMVQDQWTFGVSAQGGFTLYGIGDDHHWMRTPVLNFIDNLGSAPLLSVGASASYEVAEGMNLFLAGTAEKIFTARGDTDIYNNDTGVLLGTDADGGGGDLFAASITGGIKGTF
jgi:plasminogen activator